MAQPLRRRHPPRHRLHQPSPQQPRHRRPQQPRRLQLQQHRQPEQNRWLRRKQRVPPRKLPPRQAEGRAKSGSTRAARCITVPAHIGMARRKRASTCPRRRPRRRASSRITAKPASSERLNHHAATGGACSDRIPASSTSSKIATARVHPADAPRILCGKQEITKPSPGSASRLCSFSRWQ